MCALRGTVPRQSGDRERREQTLEEERESESFGLWRTELQLLAMEDSRQGGRRRRCDNSAAARARVGEVGQWQQGRGEHGYVTRADDTERVVGHVVEQVELQRPPRYGWMNGWNCGAWWMDSRLRCKESWDILWINRSGRDPLGFSSPGPGSLEHALLHFLESKALGQARFGWLIRRSVRGSKGDCPSPYVFLLLNALSSSHSSQPHYIFISVANSICVAQY